MPNSDPRLPIFIAPDGNGDYTGSPIQADQINLAASQPGPYYGTAVKPITLVSYAEAKFLEFLKKDGGLSWTVMIKDPAVSHGGWVFSSVEQDWQKAIANLDPLLPDTAPGLGTCMRCHASADAELIFADTANKRRVPAENCGVRRDLGAELGAGAQATECGLVWRRLSKTAEGNPFTDAAQGDVHHLL